MTDQTPIARVVAVTGEVYVRNENGELRLLAPDSVIYPGERIVADPGESVELAMANGQSMIVDSQTPLTFSEDMLPETADNVDDAAVAGDSVDELLKALESGEEIDELLEAPAAGAGGDEGHSFVVLERIIEGIDPQNQNVGNTAASVAAINLLGGGNDDQDTTALGSGTGTAPVNTGPALTISLAASLNENSASAGDAVASFIATDDSGTPGVDFTPGSNASNYYVISGTSVNLTAAGAAFVQGGGTLPAVSLTATDAGGLTAVDSETPTVTSQNDGPAIDVTLSAALEENSATAGDTVATFVASDEEDGTPGVDFTPGSNASNYYVISGTSVNLTAAGAAFVQGGGTLPAVSLTATDAGGLTAVDSETPTVTSQNDGPAIDVTLSAALEENSATAGDTVATFVASDEEDGTPGVDFTPGSNASNYYVISGTSVNLTAAGAAFVQGGGTLPAVSLTATDAGGLTAVDSETPTVTSQNDGPAIDVTLSAALEENSATAGDTVATFVASDEEDGTPGVDFTPGSNASNYYVISGTSVNLTAAGAAFVQGGGTLPAVSLTATDAGGLTAVDSETPTVTSQNDGPAIDVTLSAALEENSATAGDTVATFVASDEEDGTPGVDFTPGSNASNYYVISGTSVNLTAAGAAFVQGGGTLPAVSLTATDAGGLTAVDSETPTVTSQNDGPAIDVTLSAALEENSATAGDTVATFVASDEEDGTPGVDFTPGSNASNYYVISGTSVNLTAAGAAFVQGGGTLPAVSLTATDAGGLTAVDSETPTVTSQNDGPAIDVTLSAALEENSATAGDTVATFVASDEEDGTPGVDFTPGSNASNYYVISGTSVNLTAAGAAFVQGGGTLPAVSLTATDAGGLTAVDSETPTVTSQNDGPAIDVTLSAALEENSATAGDTVATFVASDEEDGTPGVDFTPGSNASNYYVISGTSVNLTAAGAAFVQGGGTLPAVSLTATDAGGLTAVDSETPTVTSQNDGPAIDVTLSAALEENSATAGDTVATFVASDEEDGTPGVDFTPGSNASNYYVISGTSVNLTAAGAAFVQGGGTLPAVSLTATDAGGLTAVDSETPTVTSQNDGPAIDVTLSAALEENSATAGDTVATFVASDEEDGTPGVDFTPGSNASNYYVISGTSVNLTAAGAAFVQGGGTLPAVSLTATDAGGLTAVDSETPTVTSQNDGPAIDVTLSAALEENSATAGDTVATFVASDEEDGTPGVDFTPGSNASNYYVISGTSVNLTAAGAAFVQGGGTLPAVSLTATDAGGLTAVDSETPTVTSQNDGPAIDVTLSAALEENSATAGDTVATFVASDEEDGTPGVDFTPGSNASNYYVISGTSVNLTAAGAAFVQGGGTLPAVSLTATDAGGLTAVDSETPTVTSQNDGPAIDVTLSAALEENSATAGDTVATFVASDEEDGTPGVDFTPGSNASNYYVISGTSVNLTAAGAAFVQGGGTLPAVSLTATDAGGLIAVDSETPTVTSQNDGPAIDVTLSAALEENSATAGDTVATFVASDEEDGTPGVDFTPGSNASNYYVISGTSVNLTAAGAAFVQGGGTLPAVSLTATDAGGLTAVDSETPTVTSQNDGPAIDVTLSAALEENSATAGDTVATFVASDEEDGTPGVDFTPGSNASNYYVISGTSVNLTAAGAAFVQGGGTLPAVSLTATDAGGLTAVDSETPTVTSQNDGPVAVDDAITVNEDSVFASIIDLDANDLDEEGDTLSVVAGTFTTVQGGSIVIASDGSYIYTPKGNFSGSDSVDYTVTDGALTDTGTLNITVNPVADDPVIAQATATSPTSSGLKFSFYDELNNSNRNASSQEGATSGASPTTEVRQMTGFGTSKMVINTNQIQADGSTIEIEQGDTYAVTGLIYLQAGSTYQFSGYHDDSLRIELGGQTLISSTGDSYGNYGVGTTKFNGASNIFTATEDGYYTFEAYVNNVSGPGQFSLNINVDGAAAKELNGTNFSIYSDATDLVALGGQFSNFVGSGINAGGGYFPASSNTGITDSLISIDNLSVTLTDTDGSEVIQSVVIKSIPVGVMLISGVNSFTATAGNTQVDVTNWSLADLHVLPPAGFTGAFDLDITAISQETANNDTAESSETITVNVVDFNTATAGIDTDLLGDGGIIRGTSGDDVLSTVGTSRIVDGDAGNDIITGGSGIDLLVGGLGDDVLTGKNGDDLLYGNAGDDNISGGAGSDFLAGGTGNDNLSGGSSSDILYGGEGNDTLVGGSGVDTFAWELGDQGTLGAPAVDMISDFDDSGSNHDVLDLRDLLVDEENNDLTDYLFVEKVGADTVVHVSTNGGFASGFNASAEEQTIQLTGVDLVTGFADQSSLLQNLVDSGKLITD